MESLPPLPGTRTSYRPSVRRWRASRSSSSRSRAAQSTRSFSSAKRQAAHTPSASKWIVSFFDSRVCAYSTVDDGRWLEITQRAQKRTSAGRPNFASRGAEAEFGTRSASAPGHEGAEDGQPHLTALLGVELAPGDRAGGDRGR